MREQPAIIGELNFGYDVEGARLEGEPPPRAGVERRHGSENRTSEAIRATGIRMVGASMTRRRPAEGFRGGGSKGKGGIIEIWLFQHLAISIARIPQTS